MGRTLQKTSILCIIMMLSAIAVSQSDRSAEDDRESVDSASGRRLLGTSYTMPKLNFCELIHHSVVEITRLTACCSVSRRKSCRNMRNIRHRLRLQVAEYAMLRTISIQDQKVFNDFGSNFPEFGNAANSGSDPKYEPNCVWRKFCTNVLPSYIKTAGIQAVDFGGQRILQPDFEQCRWRL